MYYDIVASSNKYSHKRNQPSIIISLILLINSSQTSHRLSPSFPLSIETITYSVFRTCPVHVNALFFAFFSLSFPFLYLITDQIRSDEVT